MREPSIRHGPPGIPDAVLAWYFVVMWGSGYLATKAGLHYAAPFTFLTLRFGFGVFCMLVLVASTRPRWPTDRRTVFHIVVAGLLMHVGNLGGSHYAQYLGMSAGITALLLATQPLLTAVLLSIAGAGDRMIVRQWVGIALGLVGVALVVGHKIDVDAASRGSLLAIAVSLASITIGTLYQRRYCAQVDLRSAGLIQFVAASVVLAPLATECRRLRGALGPETVPGGRLPRHRRLDPRGQRAAHADAARCRDARDEPDVPDADRRRVPRMGAVRRGPSVMALIGIAVTCAGVALVTWQRRTTVADVET